MKAKVPIVPVVLVDSYKVFEEWSLRRVNTQVHYLPAIYSKDYDNMTTVEVADIVNDRIRSYIRRVLANGRLMNNG
ncbi:MAG: hypothetical protein NC307_15535, partial [Roseburia sp.]|nr:hypothetical protein [Roseburia sp.]